MWITWVLLVALSVGLIIFNIISLLRIKASRIAGPEVEVWSPEQKRIMTFLNLLGAIGVIIIWFALVYVLIDTGGQHLIQPWRNKIQLWAVPYALLYTSFFLGFTRRGFLALRNWRPSSRLWFRLFIIAAFFVACLASILDLYLPPPAGSRQVGALYYDKKNGVLEMNNSRAFVPIKDFWR
jgi:hypothetical protein